MEIFTLLESLEDVIEKSRSLPFSDKGIVDKEEILDLIKEIRLKLPDELKQAKWVKEERQRILVEAQKEADGIVKEAENRIISMIDEHEITRKAYEQKKEIIENANERSREISNGTKEYADELLQHTEEVLTTTLGNLEKNVAEALKLMEISLEDTIKTLMKNINFNKNKKEKIIKINWENNDLNKFKKIKKCVENKKDIIIFIKGKENYIKNINSNIEKWTENYKKARIIDCYDIEEIGNRVVDVMNNYKNILNTTGETKIKKL